MIIGLAGAKHSGKNTVAKFIAEIFGDRYEVKEWSFAEDLKKSAAAALGYDSTVSAVQFCDSLKERGRIVIMDDDNSDAGWEWSISGREYLQYYGTEAHRDIFGDNFWVENLMAKIYPDFEDWGERIDIITDVRFPNEAEYIRAEGGKAVRIRRPEVEIELDHHASEVPLPDELVDLEIWNEETLDILKLVVGAEIGELLK